MTETAILLIASLCNSHFLYDLKMPRKFQEEMIAKRLVCIEETEKCLGKMKGVEGGDTFRPCVRKGVKKAKKYNAGHKV